jgi:flagellar biosynthesis chaperone FliJ
MKKKLIKELLELDKLLKYEQKTKEKTNKELQKLNTEINTIEEKLKNKKIKKNEKS